MPIPFVGLVSNYSELNGSVKLRSLLPATTLLELGFQLFRTQWLGKVVPKQKEIIVPKQKGFQLFRTQWLGKEFAFTAN